MNVAEDKPAHQRSTASGGDAQFAVDDNNETCSSTQCQGAPHSAWWALDLQEQHKVWKVKITNTADNGKHAFICNKYIVVL